jgi:hypothetical protein
MVHPGHASRRRARVFHRHAAMDAGGRRHRLCVVASPFDRPAIQAMEPTTTRALREMHLQPHWFAGAKMSGVRNAMLNPGMRRLLPGTLILALVVIALGLGFHRLRRYSIEIDRVLNCGLNLKLVGQALKEYTVEFPESGDLSIEHVVNELVRAGRLSADTTQCAISGKLFCFRGTLSDLTAPIDESFIIGYELGSFHRTKVGSYALFANGYSRRLSPTEYESLLGR